MAQEPAPTTGGAGTVTITADQRPARRPEGLVPPADSEAEALAASVAGQDPAPEAAPADAATAAAPANPPRDPNKGPVSNLPLPRFVSLKTGEGNARRGPGLSHRIDWVFTQAGLPLKVTAEYENWRRVEDQDGAGGWVHYTLLSGSRTVLVEQDMAEFHMQPEGASPVVFQAEYGVIGRILACDADWCRITVSGEKGWVKKSALWGVDPGEIID